ncbi:MAG TPA: bifunctional DNA primase/helicase [Paludibacter sp.]|nr:bifunctional DNA primase/helicase [Paludibacter sp.]
MLTKEEVLARTDKGLNVFKHYLPFPFRVGRNFLNPLYEDKKASCNVYFDRTNDQYKLKDYGNDNYSGDCFHFVGKILGTDCRHADSFMEILQKINQDLTLGMENPSSNSFPSPWERVVEGRERSLSQSSPKSSILESKEVQPKPIKPFSIKVKQFSELELTYWQQYGITQDVLKRYQVVSLKEFASENNEGKPYKLTPSDKEPIFAYQGKRYLKLYRPSSAVRFQYAGDLSDKYCFGLEQLPPKGNILFITGGEKDVLSLIAKGFTAICFNSETTNIPQSTIRKLTYRFKHVVILYDCDKTGMEASAKHEQQLTSLGVKRMILPLKGTKEEKDISDFFKLGNSRESFQKLFIQFLDTIYAETMAVLKSCEIDFTKPPISAEMIISINNVPLGTQGNLCCITGGEGTGKSNYICALVAGTLNTEDDDIDTLGTHIKANRQNKAVLLYDTEQSELQLYKNTMNSLRRAKQKHFPESFRAYCLTGMSRKERLQAIIQSMDKFYYEFGGIHLVIIDGIADLIHSANDEAESIRIVDELYRLAGIYQTCIVCVLHFIPNGLKLRGHLGSELQRKSAGILSIEKDDQPGVSVVKVLKVRDGSPLDVPLIQFAWDKKEEMHVYLGEKTKEEKEKRKENELTTTAKTIFAQKRYYTYQELTDKLQEYLDVKERTAKGYIKFMREKDIILKDPSKTSYFVIGHN